jgi:hypothetical protein
LFTTKPPARNFCTGYRCLSISGANWDGSARTLGTITVTDMSHIIATVHWRTANNTCSIELVLLINATCTVTVTEYCDNSGGPYNAMQLPEQSQP